MATDLESAVQRLRDSVAALRSHEQVKWLAGIGHVYTADRGWWLANGLNAPLAKHIATTASPPTVLLLADLLEAVPATLDFPADFDFVEALVEVISRADRLRAAILHTEEQP